LYSLHHVIDLDWMMEAYRLTRKDGCSRHRRRHGGRIRSEPGGQSSGSRGSHQVRPLSRAASPPSIHPQSGWLAKDAGIPTFEDKVAQRAVTMVLEEIYEQDFRPVHTASGRDGRLTRRSALCRTCSGPSVFIGCSISTYASTSIRSHTPTFERFLTNESRTASSEG